jgi:trehalose-6-phosphate synthase
MAALDEAPEAARARMAALRAGVITDDVAKWADDFLHSLRPPAPADVT